MDESGHTYEAKGGKGNQFCGHRHRSYEAAVKCGLSIGRAGRRGYIGARDWTEVRTEEDLWIIEYGPTGLIIGG